MPRLDSLGIASLTPKILAELANQGILSGESPSRYSIHNQIINSACVAREATVSFFSCQGDCGV